MTIQQGMGSLTRGNVIVVLDCPCFGRTMILDASGYVPIPIAPEGFKSGFIAIIGRPNVGKSTLMNQLVGQKIAITSPVAQTTRNRLQGILTTDRAQLIFVDTPGIHKPHHELGRVLVKNAQSAIASVDLVLFILDGSVPMGGGDRYIAALLQERSTSAILGFNKCDCPAAQDPSIKASYAPLIAPFGDEVFEFSALTGEGLETLQSHLIDRLEPGPYYYPPELVTDQPERFIMGELIREQILLLTRQEIPHSVAIAIEKVEESPERTSVYAAITVERDSQKGILIGKQGSMLKAIGSAARQQIQKLIEGDVFLQLFVKVEPNWRQSRSQLQDLGYRLED
jgi:GTP-binding protein Era